MQFIAAGIKRAVALGFSVGVYSSLYEWAQTVGSSTYVSLDLRELHWNFVLTIPNCSAFKNYPLWYAHYDGVPGFKDPSFWAFGGWTKPTIKQFDDHGPCMDIDRSWYPDSMGHPSLAFANASATIGH